MLNVPCRANATARTPIHKPAIRGAIEIPIISKQINNDKEIIAKVENHWTVGINVFKVFI